MNDDPRRTDPHGTGANRGVQGLANGDPVPRNGTPWQTLSARVISLVSRKGGVGKTTSAVNLGAAFALSGHTVLIVGVDPQCGVARSLGYAPQDLNASLQDIFTQRSELNHLAQRAPLPNLYFVSAGSATLADEERYLQWMANDVDTFVAQIDRARNLYDTILIDCPPALNDATRAALLASDAYLVPVQAEELCCDSVVPLLDSVAAFGASMTTAPEPDVQDDRAPELAGLFLTMANPHTRMGRHAAARIALEHGPRLYETVIPRTVRLSEMALRGKPTVIYDRRSMGSRAYFDLADEIIARYLTRREQARLATSAPVTEGGGARDGLASATTGGDGEPQPADRLSAAESWADGAERPAASGDSLVRLIAKLQADELAGEATAVAGAFGDNIDMVSLDDLLAEEENRADDEFDWDDESWQRGSDGRHLH